MSGGSEKPAMERRTICFPHHGTQGVLQHGDKGFKDEIDRLYVPAENNAMEQLIELKTNLRTLPTEEFWGALTEGLSRILGAEICFVMKRVLVDDQNSAVEMPPIGEPGSCIMAAALHYCANDGTRTTHKSTKFHAYGCPCAYMRHDKVFVIPDRLGDFITNNPNKLPTPCEAYLAVPLFEEGKCFAHFGAMWSVEGAAQRKLSWAFSEMIMHSLEDMIAQRFVEGTDFIRQSTRASQEKTKIIPHDAVTIAQSLRPYAGSLSHELRTPMQGIVGMLDVMYATVQEAVETQNDPRIRRVFEQLKENIEIVQDSSRRAVEAADNVVHAYDMDMSIPEVPQALLDEPTESPFSATVDRRPEILVAGNNLPITRPNKRRRDDGGSRSGSDVSAYKFPRLGRAPSSCQRCSEQEAQQGVRQAERIQAQSQVGAVISDAPTAEDVNLAASVLPDAGRIIAPGLRHASFRELIQNVMSECLKVGGRPDYATTQETDFGEVLEVRTRGSDGSIGQKLIEWSVDPSVPSTMFIDEKDLCKLISCVLLNALKFTDKYDGKINVHTRMSHRGRYISIKISDNGPGIPAAFLPKLFKPFSQENGSITRPSEGLGLGLMVGKGIARKLGGDLICTRAETAGSQHGTEFEIKVPVHAGETISRPASPYGSPLPRKATIVASTAPQVRPPPVDTNSPRRLSQALHQVVTENPFAARMPLPKVVIPSTPPSPKSQSMTSGPETDVETTSSPPASSLPSPPIEVAKPRPRVRKTVSNPEIDRDLASKYPLTFLVAEDNKINRKLLVSMLSKFGYKKVVEAHDGAEAVRQMAVPRPHHEQIDVVLMDLWMPLMDGYEAAERILGDKGTPNGSRKPTVLAVTADVTDGALERAAEVGMQGFMTKPYKMLDLQRLITEYCASHKAKGLTAAV